METVLQINNLTKKYNNNYALKDVSLTLNKGDIYGLIGKNGAGKTTLIKLITQLIHPSTGTIQLFGSQNQKELTQALKFTGSVIETPAAYDHLSAADNLNYYCQLRGIVHPKQCIKESLELVNLSDTQNKKFKDFSLGMKQKLGIAIAILSKPDLLILDEPINGLDPLAIVEFRRLVKKLQEEQGMTIIISSHILSELYQVANRFGILDQGQLIREISKQEFEHLSQDFIVLETPNIEKASHIIQNEMNLKIKVIHQNLLHIFGQSHQVSQIIQYLVKNNIEINGIYYSKQNLETYFTDLINIPKEVPHD